MLISAAVRDIPGAGEYSYLSRLQSSKDDEKNRKQQSSKPGLPTASKPRRHNMKALADGDSAARWCSCHTRWQNRGRGRPQRRLAAGGRSHRDSWSSSDRRPVENRCRQGSVRRGRRQRPSVAWPFKIRRIATIVFQFRVVAGTP